MRTSFAVRRKAAERRSKNAQAVPSSLYFDPPKTGVQSPGPLPVARAQVLNPSRRARRIGAQLPIDGGGDLIPCRSASPDRAVTGAATKTNFCSRTGYGAVGNRQTGDVPAGSRCVEKIAARTQAARLAPGVQLPRERRRDVVQRRSAPGWRVSVISPIQLRRNGRTRCRRTLTVARESPVRAAISA